MACHRYWKCLIAWYYTWCHVTQLLSTSTSVYVYAYHMQSTEHDMLLLVHSRCHIGQYLMIWHDAEWGYAVGQIRYNSSSHSRFAGTLCYTMALYNIISDRLWHEVVKCVWQCSLTMIRHDVVWYDMTQQRYAMVWYRPSAHMYSWPRATHGLRDFT